MEIFEKLIEKNYPGLNFILLSDENHLPGAIIDKDDSIIDHIKNINLFELNKCVTKTIDANIVTGDLSYENKLNFNIATLGLIKLNTKATRNYSVSFKFTNVKKIVFDNENGGYYENEIKEKLMQLKKSNKARFNRIKKDFIITQSLFIEEVEISFKRNGSVLSEAEFKDVEEEISINCEFEWNANGKMILKNNNKVPFGVIDLKIKNNLNH